METMTTQDHIAELQSLISEVGPPPGAGTDEEWLRLYGEKFRQWVTRKPHRWAWLGMVDPKLQEEQMENEQARHLTNWVNQTVVVFYNGDPEGSGFRYLLLSVCPTGAILKHLENHNVSLVPWASITEMRLVPEAR